MKKKKSLTPQQRRFICEYANSLNADKAAQKAGYKSETAKAKIKELLQDPLITAEIHAEIEKTASTLNVSVAFIVKKLLQIITFSSEKEAVLDKTGEPTGAQRLRDAAVALRALDSLARIYERQKDETSATIDSQSVRIMCIENLDENKI